MILTFTPLGRRSFFNFSLSEFAISNLAKSNGIIRDLDLGCVGAFGLVVGVGVGVTVGVGVGVTVGVGVGVGVGVTVGVGDFLKVVKDDEAAAPGIVISDGFAVARMVQVPSARISTKTSSLILHISGVEDEKDIPFATGAIVESSFTLRLNPICVGLREAKSMVTVC